MIDFDEKDMPIFIDSHKSNKLSKNQLNRLVNLPTDKYGVTPIELFLNKNEKKLFCVLAGPNKEAIVKHHNDLGLKCDFILEVTQAKPETKLKTERLSAIGELAARVAHDLRNPLGVIKNAAELIEMSSKDTADEPSKKRITIIQSATEKMLRQVNDVLDFVRIRPLQVEKNSVSEILNSSLKMRIPDNILITKPQNDATVYCDDKQMEVVFGNLIINAIQAMEHGGEIKLRIIDKPNEVIVEVEDSGPGILDEDQAKIFDPLFTTKSSGTGLGLVSCKNVVEQHGGTITFRNNPTVFAVKLPKKEIKF